MAYSYTQQDPFAHERDRGEMQAALRDVVTIRDANGKPVGGPTRSGSGGLDAYGADDLLGAYGSQPSSPVKTKPSAYPTAAPHRPDVHRSKSNGGGGERERTPSKKKDKSDMPLDVIDRLDISGLYGGGALQRHDGPYAAATASRNQGPRAPMAAFDPSALAPPGTAPTRPANAPRKSSKNLSARAQATLAAMDDFDGGRRDSPYGGAAVATQPRRRGSDSSINMGYPDRKAGKGAQLIEMYGVRDVEAWEDYGRREYKGGDSGTSSRESVIPSGVSKEDRMERAQSIWDIEATLAAGKPVGQAPPPPMPVFPSEYNSSPLYDANDNKPKRSKSLAARLRGGGRKSATEGDAHPLPLMTRDQNGQQHEEQAQQYFDRERAPERPDNDDAAADRKYRNGAPPLSPVDRFKGGEGITGSRSAPQHSNSNGDGSALEGSSMGRRPSVMQRLFSSRKKDKGDRS